MLRLVLLLLCLLAAAALGSPQASRHEPAASYSELTPTDKAVISAPFAPSKSRALLRTNLVGTSARHVTNTLLPTPAPSAQDTHIMGWQQTDQGYWRSIPEAAKTIPADWSGLPSVRYSNSELGGTREVRLNIGSKYDQWLLTDKRHNLYACISVERSTHRVYFMEITRGKAAADSGKWVYHTAFDNCFSCHASGLRAIRPLDEHGVDRRVLDKFNRRILEGHASDFGDSVDEAKRGETIADSACTGCHNGVNRGKLYDIHRHSMSFKCDMEKTMPPASHHA